MQVFIDLGEGAKHTAAQENTVHLQRALTSIRPGKLPWTQSNNPH
jgi:hypothetical protein